MDKENEFSFTSIIWTVIIADSAPINDRLLATSHRNALPARNSFITALS
jgi:hypothetical protein